MDHFLVKPSDKLSPAERERRLKIVRRADANNRIEGIFRDPSSNKIFDAFVRGDIEATEIVPLLKAKSEPR
jgi:hypothetical protein